MLHMNKFLNINDSDAKLWCNIKINDVNSPVDAQQPSQLHFYHQFSGDENVLIYFVILIAFNVCSCTDLFGHMQVYKTWLLQTSGFTVIPFFLDNNKLSLTTRMQLIVISIITPYNCTLHLLS